MWAVALNHTLITPRNRRSNTTTYKTINHQDISVETVEHSAVFCGSGQLYFMDVSAAQPEEKDGDRRGEPYV